MKADESWTFLNSHPLSSSTRSNSRGSRPLWLRAHAGKLRINPRLPRSTNWMLRPRYFVARRRSWNECRARAPNDGADWPDVTRLCPDSNPMWPDSGPTSSRPCADYEPTRSNWTFFPFPTLPRLWPDLTLTRLFSDSNPTWADPNPTYFRL